MGLLWPWCGLRLRYLRFMLLLQRPFLLLLLLLLRLLRWLLRAWRYYAGGAGLSGIAAWCVIV